MSGLLKPERRETFIGYAAIKEVFQITKVGKVAGCQVTEGIVERGAGVRLLRDNVVIHEGKLKTLKRFKDEVKEVPAGPGMRHGLRELRRHPRRRHHRVLPRRERHPHALSGQDLNSEGAEQSAPLLFAPPVIPAKAGTHFTHCASGYLDPRLRGDDRGGLVA